MQMLPRGGDALKVVQSVHRKVRRTPAGELKGEELVSYLDDIQLRLQGIHQAIQQTWFTPEQ